MGVGAERPQPLLTTLLKEEKKRLDLSAFSAQNFRATSEKKDKNFGSWLFCKFGLIRQTNQAVSSLLSAMLLVGVVASLITHDEGRNEIS